MTMVHALHHFALQNFFQFFQVEDHACYRVRLTGTVNFQM